MSNNSASIRGSRVGAGPMGESDRGFQAEQIVINYYCLNGHEHPVRYSAAIEPEEIPVGLDCPSCGFPAGTDKANPPQIEKNEPYKTHLAYVKERRTEAEAKELLEEAVAAVRERRIRLAAAAMESASK